MQTIIDTHTHLYDLPCAQQALADSAAAGVSDIVALGVDLASHQQHRDMVKAGAPLRIHLGVGIHPGNIKAQEIEPCFSLFHEELLHRRAIAIGETGLDFWYQWVRQDDAKKDEQRRVFQRHLDLAKEFDCPVVVHCRGVWRECLDMIKASGVKKAVFHWYSGPMDVLKDILDAGFFISGSLALEYSPESRKAAEFAPLDRILVETDTPVRGSTPKDVWRTFKALCAIKEMDEATGLAAVNANARRFFHIT